MKEMFVPFCLRMTRVPEYIYIYMDCAFPFPLVY
jgi:hypothetical protein